MGSVRHKIISLYDVVSNSNVVYVHNIHITCGTSFVNVVRNVNENFYKADNQLHHNQQQ